MPKLTYRDSGVDLAIYEESMARLPKLLRQTHCPRVMPWNNGFAGLFQLDFADGLFSRKYEQPVLVSCTDGVGTKLLVAQMADSPDSGKCSDACQPSTDSHLGHGSVGIDLVAMCVNDAICCGIFWCCCNAVGAGRRIRLSRFCFAVASCCRE